MVRHAGVRRGAHLTSPGPTPRAFRSPSSAWARTSLPPTRDSPASSSSLWTTLPAWRLSTGAGGRRGSPARGLPAPGQGRGAGRDRVRLRHPGNRGRRRRMNAGAYGGDIAGVLRRARRRPGRRAVNATELGLRYRSSAFDQARWWLPRSLALGRGPSARSRRQSPRCRRGARPLSRRTSERSGASSRTGAGARADGGADARGLWPRGFVSGGAQISPKHANCRERGSALGRRGRAHRRGSAPRARAVRWSSSSPRSLLGSVGFPARPGRVGPGRRAANSASWSADRILHSCPETGWVDACVGGSSARSSSSG